MVCVVAILAGCRGQARGVETIVSIRAGAGSVTSEQLASKACLWISGLTNYHTVIGLLLAHDAATLAECMALAPPLPVPLVPRPP